MTIVPLWLWWLSAFVFYTVGEAASKRWGMEPAWSSGAVAFFAYAASSVGWLGIMAHTNRLTLMSTVWEGGCVLVAAIMGVGLYGERLTVQQWVGFFLALVAGYLLLAE